MKIMGERTVTEEVVYSCDSREQANNLGQVLLCEGWHVGPIVQDARGLTAKFLVSSVRKMPSVVAFKEISSILTLL